MIRILIPLVFSLATVSATFNMIFKKIDVQVGAVGSKDDVRIEICDPRKCCTTKKLSYTFGSEWQANEKETWKGSDLGNCSDILFDNKLSNINVSILKELNKQDPLEVKSMVLTAQAGSDIQKFKCGSYRFTSTNKIKTNTCSSQVVPTLKVKKIHVQVGTDGTDEDISMEICDSTSTQCCTTDTLYQRTSSEWVKGKNETWTSKLGNCSTILFISGSPSLQVSVINTSSKKKDPLEITSIIIEASPTSDNKIVEKFICASYKLSIGDGIKTNTCFNEISSSKPGSSKRPLPVPVASKPGSSKRPLPVPVASKSVVGSANLKVKKIHVQVGADGTDEDISMQICNSSKCCTTDTLYHITSVEWVKGKNETWDKRLGNCSKILFISGSPSLQVSVINTSSKKKDPLTITSIIIEASPTSGNKKVEKFICGNYKLSSGDGIKTNTCFNEISSSRPGSSKRPLPAPVTPTKLANLEKFKVNNVVVQMGDDGTNDDIALEICSANSILKCCDTGNLNSFGDDWSRKDKETWKNKDLGLCKTKKFDACKGFSVAVKKKDGKDSLTISNITLEITEENNVKDVKKFVCSNYTIGNTDTIKRKTCTLDPKSSKPSCPQTTPTINKPNPSQRKNPTPSSGPQSSKSENVILKEFKVQVGRDGTKDSVYAKVCTVDKKTCCVTPILKKREKGNNNWLRNGTETWSGTTLKLCDNKEFTTQTSTTVTNLLESKLILTLEKSGSKDGMKLDSFNIEAVSATGSAKRSFKCGKIVVDKNTDNTATKECVAQFPKTFTSNLSTGPCLRSGRNCKPTTTTRGPFRSNGK